jgi:hypothetical protein
MKTGNTQPQISRTWHYLMLVAFYFIAFSISVAMALSLVWEQLQRNFG